MALVRGSRTKRRVGPKAARLKPSRVAASAAFTFAVALMLLATPAAAQRQSIETRIKVPGIGQEVAAGIYFFKFAIVDAEGQTLWSHDATSVGGDEPDTQMPLPVDNGQVSVTLGEPPLSGQPELSTELLGRQDLTLRIWYTNGLEGRFRRLPDQKLGGKGLAFNAERLQGKSADDFETAGAVWKHEQDFEHAPHGRIPGGRLYHASSPLGRGRALEVHFDVPDGETSVSLTLHAMPPAGPPSIGELRMQTAQTTDQGRGAPVTVVNHVGEGWLAGIREVYDFCNTCLERRSVPETRIFLDGVLFEAWKTARDTAPEEQGVGRVDNLLLLGLVRFDRSLKVTSEHRGVADAAGATTLWYYLADEASGVPGAMQVLLDDVDITSTLTEQPAARSSLARGINQMIASLYPGAVDLGQLSSTELAARPATRTWLAQGASTSYSGHDPATIVAVGEAWIPDGQRTFGLTSSGSAILEVEIDGRFERITEVAGAGNTKALLDVAKSMWHRVRLVATTRSDELDVSWSLDNRVPRVRTESLLGGDGTSRWSTGSMRIDTDLLGAGAHVLKLRNQSEREGQLEYQLLIE